MTTNVYRGSAKIYDFPARGRFAAGGDRKDNTLATLAANFTSPRVAKTVFGSAWYHDEAVQDASPPRKN
jgi:hypothetical protein